MSGVQAMIIKPWIVPAKLLRVIDGDTLELIMVSTALRYMVRISPPRE